MPTPIVATVPDVLIRPMRVDDVAAAEQISDDAFYELDLRTLPRDWPEPERRTPEHKERWSSRTLRFLEQDPGGCWVAEDGSGVAGFAYTNDSRLELLAATDEATATALLWACLAEAGDEYLVPHVTAANQWAVDVGLTAGLELAQSGYLAVRGMAPPAPYVHNGALL